MNIIAKQFQMWKKGLEDRGVTQGQMHVFDSMMSFIGEQQKLIEKHKREAEGYRMNWIKCADFPQKRRGEGVKEIKINTVLTGAESEYVREPVDDLYDSVALTGNHKLKVMDDLMIFDDELEVVKEMFGKEVEITIRLKE